MHQNNFTTIEEVLKDIPCFIETNLSNVITTLIQKPDEKFKAHLERDFLFNEIKILIGRLGVTNTDAAKITGCGRGLIYFIKKKAFENISTEKCIFILKTLKEFEKDLELISFENCVLKHKSKREFEKLKLDHNEIKKEAFIEIDKLLNSMKLSAFEIGSINKNFRAPAVIIKHDKSWKISLKKTLEFLMFLRSLKNINYVSRQVKREDNSEKIIVFNEVSTLLILKKINPVKAESLGICKKGHAYSVLNNQFKMVSLNSAKKTLQILKNLPESN